MRDDLEPKMQPLEPKWLRSACMTSMGPTHFLPSLSGHLPSSAFTRTLSLVPCLRLRWLEHASARALLCSPPASQVAGPAPRRLARRLWPAPALVSLPAPIHSPPPRPSHEAGSVPRALKNAPMHPSEPWPMAPCARPRELPSHSRSRRQQVLVDPGRSWSSSWSA